jgi:diguanylate cyclase (GGDEF)-like protein
MNSTKEAATHVPSAAPASWLPVDPGTSRVGGSAAPHLISAATPRRFPCPVTGEGAPAGAGKPEGAGSAGTKPPRSPARVLYMEDSPLQAAYVRSVLEAAGYEVLCCADPFRFKPELDTFHPDVVLMDIVLPGKSGYELVRGLRAEERHATLPVLFLTSEAEIEARIETTRAGGDDHLVKPVRRELLLSSVGSRIERSRRVRDLISRDGLTQLFTASALLEAADEVGRRQHDESEPRAMWVMLDLDHFKRINDTFGHPAGDRVLTGLADLLRHNLRTQDIIGRCGGEEFAIILEGIGEPEAIEVIERLRAGFAAIAQEGEDGTTFQATFSAGIAPLVAGMSVEEWRSAADRALYVAKARGRNRLVMGPVSKAMMRDLPTQPLPRVAAR